MTIVVEAFKLNKKKMKKLLISTQYRGKFGNSGISAYFNETSVAVMNSGNSIHPAPEYSSSNIDISIQQGFWAQRNIIRNT